VYSGWPPNLNTQLGLSEMFQFISSTCKGIGMVAFCFISGLLVAYSFDKIEAKSKSYTNNNWKNFITKKFRRLLIPAIIWGIVYAVFFKDYMLTEYSPSFINGTHLWFLPMLFLLMLCISPVMYNKYLWVIPILIFCYFLLNSYSRTTEEFVLYFPSFVCGFLFWASYRRIKSNRNIIKYISLGLPITGGFLVYASLGHFNSIFLSYAIYLVVVAVSILLFKHFANIFSTLFDWKPISFATEQSFQIYIVHQFVIILFSFLNLPFLETASVASVIVYFSVAFIGSLVVAYIFSLLMARYSLLKYVF